MQLKVLILRFLMVLTAGATTQPATVIAQLIAPPLIQLKTQSAELLTGLPIHWGKSNAVLLEASGRMHYVSLTQIQSHKLLGIDFKPQSAIEASQLLQQELGKGFETSISGPYVIAAPIGQAARWRDRFQTLLAGYTRYFEVRGWHLRHADFPLVVVVLPNRSVFQSYLAKQAVRLPSNVAGSYFPLTNRCILYHMDSSTGVDWSETEATIVHEAVHQLAFNTGVHERLAENPLWLVEGLATMFEQPAVYDLRVNRSNIESRMLISQLQQLQPILREPGSLESRLRRAIESDKIFEEDPLPAYTVAWALTFYLSERLPNEFANYLKIQRQRSFGTYTSSARVADFRNAIQVDPTTLASQITRLMQQ